MPNAPNPNQPQPVDSTPQFFPPESFSVDQNFTLELVPSGKIKTIDLPGDHSIVVFPGLEATLTIVDNSKSVTLSITGADHQTTLENGDVLHELSGRNLAGDPFIDNGQPGLFLVAGHFSYSLHSDGTLAQPLEGQGEMVNVIDLLI
jgi:hypothetical protein